MKAFSKRANWEAKPNPWSLLLDQKKAEGASLLDLTASNPTSVGFLYPKSSCFSQLSHPQNTVYEPDPQGVLSARKAIAAYYQKKRSTSILPEDIFLTPGTSDGYHYLFRLLCDPGDEIVHAAPGYPLFDMLADLNDITLKKFHLQYRMGRWQLDAASLEASISSRTKAVLVVHPNNPTGHYWTVEEKKVIQRICAHKNIALIVDEVFWDYTWDPRSDRPHFAEPGSQVLQFTLSGISKVLGLPQMKLSWVTVHGPESDKLRVRERLAMIGDTYLSVSTPIQNALPSWFSQIDMIQGEILERIQKNRDILKNAIPNKMAALCGADGGWYAVLALAAGLDDEELAMDLLRRKNVVVHPGYFFDFFEGEYLVLSLLTDPNLFKEGVERIFI